MYTKNIIGIKDARENQIDIVGGKGANLGLMISRGIPVPDGFIITANAYKNFLKSNGILEIIEQKISNMDKETLSMEDKTEEIRNLILKAEFSKDLKEDILSRFNKFKKPIHLAVRSSATAEDLPEASFAGQQETYLNIMNKENLFESIKKCFSSLWSIRSFSYRTNNGYDHLNVGIAVVVQEMIESDISGVMFTSNPITAEKEIMIDASYNLGEAIVSGKVTPDNYVLDKNGKEIAFILGSKEISVVYSDKGTVVVNNSSDMREKRCLNNENLKELFDMTLKIEEIYKKPMDIEWAIRNKKVYILQARPITTIKKKQNKNARKQYSQKEKKYLNNMIEHFPVACYPLDYEIAMILQNMKFELFKEVGIKIESPIYMDNMGIIHMNKIRWKANPKVLRFFKVYSEYKDNEKNIEYGEKILDSCKKELKVIEQDINENSYKFSLCDVDKYMSNIISIHKRISFARFRYFLFPSVIIGEKLDKELKSINQNYTEYDLLSDLDYVTIDMNKDIDILSKTLLKNEELVKDLIEGASYEFIKEKYDCDSIEIKEFFNKYGWKSNYCCIPFSSSSWNEEPNRFIKLLKITVSENKEYEENKSGKYLSILRELERSKGKKRFKKTMLDITYYRLAHVRREESQYLWETGFGLLRMLLKQIEALLNTKKEDLLYLSFEELRKVIAIGKLEHEYMEFISYRKNHRKEAEELWEQMTLDAFSDNEKDIFEGISGSSGVVRGRVCIIKNHTEFDKLKEDNILICPYTDPEWTPLFKIAKGVVSDTGGALSHAAIVAREYNIPAVLGVGNATVNLSDGDYILVDGNNGIVKRLSEEII
ncbi:phosphoenolpyruvate synthase [Clostridium botulinum]|nr:phosphoenolpyruvate synthase [Clostridium botulinum]